MINIFIDDPVMDDIHHIIADEGYMFSNEDEQAKFQTDCYIEIVSSVELWEDCSPTHENILKTVTCMANERGLNHGNHDYR